MVARAAAAAVVDYCRLLQSSRAQTMRWLRVHGSSCVEPTHRDDFAARRINNAVAVAKALSRVVTQPLDEALLRPVLMDVDTNAALMIVIANADVQKDGHD